MRTIERSSQFKRDYKREEKGLRRDVLDALLLTVLHALANDWISRSNHAIATTP